MPYKRSKNEISFNTTGYVVFNSDNTAYIPETTACLIVNIEGITVEIVPIQFSNLKPRYDGKVYAQVNYVKNVSDSNEDPIIYFDILCGNSEDRGVIYKEMCK